jgi:hypothetical protein
MLEIYNIRAVKSYLKHEMRNTQCRKNAGTVRDEPGGQGVPRFTDRHAAEIDGQYVKGGLGRTLHDRHEERGKTVRSVLYDFRRDGE